MSNSELRDFLVSRRARLSPEAAGVQPFGGTRRVPGLRREETALLAGVSVDYYTRLERGRVNGVSDEVLEAIARALQLDDTEREHLLNLARARHPSRRSKAAAPTTVPAGLRAVLDALTVPAFVQNAHLDLLATNTPGRALYSLPDPLPTGGRAFNHLRFQLLDPRARDFYREHDVAVRNSIALLRTAVGRTPHDPELVQLVGQLSTRSDTFRRLWADQDVVRYRRGTKRYRHPDVGEVDFEYETFEMPAYPGLVMLVYTVEPASRTAEAMQLLASWAAPAATRPGLADAGRATDQDTRYPADTAQEPGNTQP